MYKVVQWSIDGLQGWGWEFIALIAESKPSVIVMNETKSVSIRVLREAWPSSQTREVLEVGKGWNTTLEARVPLAVQPGLQYSVKAIYSK